MTKNAVVTKKTPSINSGRPCAQIVRGEAVAAGEKCPEVLEEDLVMEPQPRGGPNDVDQ